MKQYILFFIILTIVNTFCQTLHSQGCNPDNTPPLLECRPYEILDLSDYDFEVYPAWYVKYAKDNCTSVKLSFDYDGHVSYLNNSRYKKYLGDTIEQIIYARDSVGNISSCITQIRIVQNYKTQIELFAKINTNFYDDQFNHFSNYFNLSFLSKSKNIFKSIKRISDKDAISFRSDFIQYDEVIDSIILEPIQEPTNYYLTSQDANEIAKYILKSGVNYSKLNYKYADVDCNGEIDLKDVYKMWQYLFNITPFDSCFGEIYSYFIDSVGNIIGDRIPYDKTGRIYDIALGQIGNVNFSLPWRDSIFDNPIHVPTSVAVQFHIENITCSKDQNNTFKIYRDKRDSIFGYQGNIGFDLSKINSLKLISPYQRSKLVNDQYLFINKFDNLSKTKFDTLEFQINTNSDYKLDEVLSFNNPVITNMILNTKGEEFPLEFDFVRPLNVNHQDKELDSFEVLPTKDQNVRLVRGNLVSTNKATLNCYNTLGQIFYSKEIQVGSSEFSMNIPSLDGQLFAVQLVIQGGKSIVKKVN